MAYLSALQPALSATPPLGLEVDDLLRKCADGDELAWGRLYESHQSAARGFLYRLGVRGDALDDACQEVFLEAFRYLPRFRGECSFKTWLYRICATQARKSRTRRRISEALHTLMSFNGTETVGEIESSTTQTERAIRSALTSLNDSERLVFVLYELEGVSGSEIAQIANCPEASVWRKLHYARKKFRSHIQEHGVIL